MPLHVGEADEEGRFTVVRANGEAQLTIYTRILGAHRLYYSQLTPKFQDNEITRRGEIAVERRGWDRGLGLSHRSLVVTADSRGMGLLPERERVRGRMRVAWALTDADLAEQRLQLLASELDRSWPGAAASSQEGMIETHTLTRLKITGQLAKTLTSTSPCESMIEIVRHTQRNVKRWREGDRRRRWTAAGILVAEQQFRRIIGYRDLAKLVIQVERHNTLATQPPKRVEGAEPVTV